jgi:hypothetical protein
MQNCQSKTCSELVLRAVAELGDITTVRLKILSTVEVALNAIMIMGAIKSFVVV